MIIAFIILGYLIGSIPFGLILTKLAGYGDIRAIGSGNIGATNVLRTGNKKLAALTLFLDGAKGAAVILFLQYFIMQHDLACCTNTIFPITDSILLAGFFAFLGHLFPIWLKFKGGKGVATTLGILIAVNPALGLACCGVWLATAFIFKYSSLAALVSIGLSPLLTHFIKVSTLDQPEEFHKNITNYFRGGGVFVYNENFLPILCAIMAILVFYKHKDNIRRLLKGEEPRIGAKKQHSETLSPTSGGEGKGEGDKAP